MNFKDQKEIIVLNAPPSFDTELKEMSLVTNINTVDKPKAFEFLLCFAIKQSDVDTIAKKWLPKVNGDVMVWFAYPKQSSKKYKCEFNRDKGWQSVGDEGWEGVKMVAVDEDWSALRFRHVSYIKTMIRSFAMSDEGKVKAKKQ